MNITQHCKERYAERIDDEFDIVYHSFGEQTNDIKIHKKGDEV